MQPIVISNHPHELPIDAHQDLGSRESHLHSCLAAKAERSVHAEDGRIRRSFLINRKSIVRVIALHVFCAHIVTRETKPEIAQAKIRPCFPTGCQLEAQRFRIKGDAAWQAAYGEGEMIEASQHEIT